MITQILAIRYPSSVDRVRSNTDHLCKVIDVVNVSQIKQHIVDLLFDANGLFNYNYCVIKHDGKLYVVEAVDAQNQSYERRTINYHPLMHMFS